MQLQEKTRAFADAGIGIVGFTYDSPELQRAFIKKHGIKYPFLSDIEARTVNALGILNEDYQPSDEHYGIPHPGIFVLNPQLEIVDKIFVNGYEKRVNADTVLARAIKALDADSAPQ